MLRTAPGGRPILRLPPASDRINQTRPDGSHALSGRVLLCSVPLRLREDAVFALVSLQRAWSLPLFGEGGRAQRGRMRSFPCVIRQLQGTGAILGVVRICRFQRGRTSSPARKLRLLPLGLRGTCRSQRGRTPSPARELWLVLFPLDWFFVLRPGCRPDMRRG